MTTATTLSSYLERYIVHCMIALVAFCVLVLTVPAREEYTAAWIASEFLSVLSLLVFCVATFEALKRLNINLWLTHALTILIANFLIVAFDFNIDLFVFGEGQMTHGALPKVDQLDAAIFWNEYFSDAKYTFVFWTLATLITHLNTRKTRQVVEEIKIEASIAKTGFLKELPPSWHSRIDVLEAQENYIQVYSADNRQIVLYRLKDAIDEMGETAGLKVHRSYWVREAAIASFKKVRGRGEITTTSGQLVPVSRTHISEVEKRVNARTQRSK